MWDAQVLARDLNKLSFIRSDEMRILTSLKNSLNLNMKYIKFQINQILDLEFADGIN